MTLSNQSGAIAQAKKQSNKTLVVVLAVAGAFLCLCIILGVSISVIGINNADLLPTFSSAGSTPTQMTEEPVAFTVEATQKPTMTPIPTLGVGSTQVRSSDGMMMVYVPQAEFSMGSEDGDPNEKPPHNVSLDDYWIDQTEVTNAMFQAFVTATGYRTSAEDIGQSRAYQPGEYTPSAEKWILVGGANWMHPQGPDSSIEGLENHPVVQVSWNDAAAYCQWAGARLPTEAEWELAARGTDGRVYPWGNGWPTGELLNFGDINLDAIWSEKGVNDGYKFTSPVGNYPAGASPYGALDMAGNVSEWVADKYGFDYYSSSPLSNPTGPDSGILHSIRSGHWSFTDDGVRSTARLSGQTTYSIDYLGFRCAAMP